MYKIKPIFEIESLHVNSPMYKMKSLQTTQYDHSSNKDTSFDEDLATEVERRQACLLKIISEIRTILTELKNELSKPKIESRTSFPTAMTAKTDLSKFGVVHEVVLNASVKNPPNSLLVLPRLWGNVNFIFSWHIHSSVKGLPKNLKKFENINGCKKDGLQFRIRVVWKDVWSDCELVVSPLNTGPLLGEVNFLRFLNRCLGAPEISDPYNAALFDSKLDACHCLGYSDNIQQTQELFNILGEGLNKSKWLVGENISIVDAACWSAINNIKNPNLSPSLNKWFKDFSSLVNVK